jgi:DNA-directed RNA polymerase subunit M/transcription elongation factor TFIIS
VALFKFFGKEEYDSRCSGCKSVLQVEREEVESGRWECPKCGKINPISPETKAEYAQRRKDEADQLRLQEEQKLHQAQQKELQKQENAKKRELIAAEVEQRRAERAQIVQAEKSRQLARQQELDRRVAEGLCPNCGSDKTQALRRGYNTGTGLTCCCLAGPIGLALGLIGSQEVLVVCKACGREYTPGRRHFA